MPDFTPDERDEAVEQDLSFLPTSEEPEQDTLAKLAELVTSYQQEEREIELAEERLKERKKRAQELGQVAIPQLLLKHGLSRIRLADGKEVTIKEDVSVTIKDDVGFAQFLTNRREDDIMKLTVAFDRMEPEAREKLVAFLDAEGYAYEGGDKVHPQTMKKYFRELLGVGFSADERKRRVAAGLCLRANDPLIESFGSVYTYHQTKVK